MSNDWQRAQVEICYEVQAIQALHTDVGTLSGTPAQKATQIANSSLWAQYLTDTVVFSNVATYNDVTGLYSFGSYGGNALQWEKLGELTRAGKTYALVVNKGVYYSATDSQRTFYSTAENSARYDLDGDTTNDTIYANNYMLSNARAYLNGLDGRNYGVANYTGIGFIDMCDFTLNELSVMQKVRTWYTDGELGELDSSTYQIGTGKNTATSASMVDNTGDYFFLLSSADASNGDYYADNSERLKKDLSDGSTARAYWLRNPNGTTNEYCVAINGGVLTAGVATTYGLAPAMLVLTAVSSPTIYSIIYTTYGGSHSNPTTYTEDTPTITLTDATKSGYTFGGWYDNSEFTGSAVTQIPIGSTGAKVLYAKFTANTYSITYNAYSGTHSNPASYTAETPTITLNDATKSGYTFGGWYDNDSFTGSAVTEIALGSTGNKTLYAKFTANTYSITYYPDGGTHSNPASYTVETPTITLTGATKGGSTFGGWYDNSEFTGSAVTEIALGSTGNKTLYAKWTASSASVLSDVAESSTIGGKTYWTFGTYNETDMQWEQLDTFVTENGTYALLLSRYVIYDSTEDNRRFNQQTSTTDNYSYDMNKDGNADSINSNNYYLSQQRAYLNNLDASATGGGDWRTTGLLNCFTASELAVIQKTLVYNETTGAAPGWNTSNATTASMINENGDYLFLLSYYDVNNRNGFTTDADRIRYDITSTGTARSWWLRSPGSTIISESFVWTSGELNFNSVFAWHGLLPAMLVRLSVPYSITYTTYGGSHSNPTTYTEETPTITLTDATKSGYVFCGWYDNDSFTGSAVTEIALGSTGNKTLYAKWIAESEIVLSDVAESSTIGGKTYWTFGTYNETDMQWEQLDTFEIENDGTYALLLSRYVIFDSTGENRRFNQQTSTTANYSYDRNNDGTPESVNANNYYLSQARAKLNNLDATATGGGDFRTTGLLNCFKASELAVMQKTLVYNTTTGAVPLYNTQDETTASMINENGDYLFLLSYYDVNNTYYSSDSDRIHNDIADSSTARNWWLRSPDSGTSAVYDIRTSGAIADTIVSNRYGLLPAMLVKVA